MRRPFIEHLQQTEQQTGRPTSRRIAELLPDIEAALARGFRREQVVSALKTEGIDVTPAMLSTYLHRLRKRSPVSTLPIESASPSLPKPAPAPEASPASVQKHFEPGDIRAIARNRPDLAELARLGREANKAKGGKP